MFMYIVYTINVYCMLYYSQSDSVQMLFWLDKTTKPLYRNGVTITKLQL